MKYGCNVAQGEHVLRISNGNPISATHCSVCFGTFARGSPDNDYVRFLESHGVEQVHGEIVTTDGVVVGHHAGLHRYTIGQRKGLGIAWSESLHVQHIDVDNNRLIVGTKSELPQMSLKAGHSMWSTMPSSAEFTAQCRIRYRHAPAPCHVKLQDDQRFEVVFGTPQTSITPGQAAVIYDGESVLGGGWIE